MKVLMRLTKEDESYNIHLLETPNVEEFILDASLYQSLGYNVHLVLDGVMQTIVVQVQYPNPLGEGNWTCVNEYKQILYAQERAFPIRQIFRPMIG